MKTEIKRINKDTFEEWEPRKTYNLKDIRKKLKILKREIKAAKEPTAEEMREFKRNMAKISHPYRVDKERLIQKADALKNLIKRLEGIK